jgi:hypothetical protein
VLGLAGTLVGTGHVIVRSLNCPLTLQSKYRSSSPVVSLLIRQLITLKAALHQITKWVQSSLINIPLQDQLVADLKIHLESCHDLILALEERIKKLQREHGDAGGLTTREKIAFLWEKSELGEFTNRLNSQVNALNLLLAAAQW